MSKYQCLKIKKIKGFTRLQLSISGFIYFFKKFKLNQLNWARFGLFFKWTD